MDNIYHQYLANKFSYDLKAAVTVFLVAIPLSLGIALASGTSAMSGLIAGIIGGIVVGLFSGSSLSVSGCAAGLVPIILLAISDLKSVDLFFAAVMISGCIQYIFGLLRAGIVAHYIPFAVIKGMLASIGIIIIFKQLPHLFGFYDYSFEDSTYLIGDYNLSLAEYIHLFYDNIAAGAVIVTLVSFSMIYICSHSWMTKNKITNTIVKYIPGSLIAIIAAVITNNALKAYFPTIALNGAHLVNLPSIYATFKLSNLFNLFAFDLSAFKNLLVYKYAFFIAAIGSIETLLSIEASDKLDKEKRITPTGKELKAQGIGNCLSGLIGGLPITSVVIRTSVNIENNAQTKVSTIIHGVLILFSLLFLTNMINQIPLAALACVLIVTGYKLTHEKLILSMFKRGAHQFVPFISTIIAILLTDLLIGVFIGLLVAIFFILKNYYNLLNIKFIANGNNNEFTIQFGDYITFLSKPSIANALAKIPDNSKLNLDFSNCSMLDFEIQELINDFITSAIDKNITIIVIQNNNILDFTAA